MIYFTVFPKIPMITRFFWWEAVPNKDKVRSKIEAFFKFKNKLKTDRTFLFFLRSSQKITPWLISAHFLFRFLRKIRYNLAPFFINKNGRALHVKKAEGSSHEAIWSLRIRIFSLECGKTKAYPLKSAVSYWTNF